LGWKVFSSKKIYIDVLEDKHPFESKAYFFDKEAIEELCEVDTNLIRSKLAKEQEGGSIHIAFEPSFEQVSWHLSRADYLGKILRGKIPTHVGAYTKDRRSWVYWYHDFRTEELAIQRLVIPEYDSDIVELLAAAAGEAQAWDLKRVVLWNPTEEVVEAATEWGEQWNHKIKVEVKASTETSIPSLRLKGGKDSKGVVWHYDEYYAWC
jgi:hypothetical protein